MTGPKHPLFDEYRRKRDFSKTPEPEPIEAAPGQKGIYVIQKHAAHALHYDLRLELDGVLLSWAVPKGPSPDPSEKRLAIRVEDHPLQYAAFEGVIPKGEYGAGTVMIWDTGRWSAAGDPHEGLRKGALKFRLFGKRLKGGWALVKIRGRDGEGKDEWLLLKEKDGYAQAGRDIEAGEKRSSETQRKMEEIASRPLSIWTGLQREALTGAPDVSKLPGARKSVIPGSMLPHLSTLVEQIPIGEDWLHEIKFDGYRILARLKDNTVRLYTRAGNDWTGKFPSIASALVKSPLKEAWLDGEVVYLDPEGRSSFEGLQGALSEGRDERLVYYVFDLPFYGHYDLSNCKLSDRKDTLERLLNLEGVDKGIIRYSGHVLGSGPGVFKNACRLSLEGVVSKRADSGYVQGRTKSWVKTRCHKRQELVVGGFTEPKGGLTGFGALLTGVYSCGRLTYTGRVGTGFDQKKRSELFSRLKPLETGTAPFADPPAGREAKGVHWVRPAIVIEAEFAQWTRDGVMRLPSYKGLREDKAPAEVIHERPSRLSVKERPEARRPETQQPLPDAILKKIRFTNPGQIMYPERGLTKKDIALYYESVAHLMLPHLSGRPLTLVRCPEGHTGPCFFQKHVDLKVPKNIKPIDIVERGRAGTYMTVGSAEGILALVQMGVLEIHTWGARAGDIEHPDKAVFDIDPDPSVPWETLCEGTGVLRGFLDELGLKSFVKTTGGKGLHVVIPLGAKNGWGEVKAFTKAVAGYLSRGLPDRFTSKMTKATRGGRVFLDYMRNIRGATAIELYSTRARPGAPVSAPVGWEEIYSIRGDTFTVENIKKRLKKGDPWQGYMEVRQEITPRMKARLGMK